MSGERKWRKARLDDLCDINPRKPSLKVVDDSTAALFVPMASVDEESGTVADAEWSTVGAVGRKSYRSFTSGDVLFAKITPCMENGKAAIVPEISTGYGFGSTEFHVLRPKPDTDARLIWHLVRQQSFRDEAANHFTGSVGQLRVPPDFLKSFEALVPVSGAAQAGLADLLDSATSFAASAATHCDAARRAIERFRHAVLAAACAGRLTTDWRDANPEPPAEPGPPLSTQAARNASAAPNTSALSDVPETWGWWAIEAVTSDVIDYRGRTPPHVAEGPIPHVRTTQIRNGRVDWNTDRFVTRDIYDEYMTRGIPRRGDVLFTMEAPMGEVGVVDRDDLFSIAQRILLLRPSDGVDGRFLALAMQSSAVRQAIELRSTGSGVVGIAYKRLRSVEVPRPPLPEQLAIVERVEQLLDLADAVARRIDVAQGRVDRSSQAVLAKAFGGELLANGAHTQMGPASCA